MKLFSKKFLGIAFCVATLGAAASFAALSNGNKNEVKVAEASSSGYVFVDITDTTNYTDGVWCHNWGTSGTTWPGTKMTHLQDNIYYCQLKSSSNNQLIFNNGNNGKQTGDILISSKLFYMDSDVAAHADDKSTGRMDYYVNSFSPSSSTTRLFIHHDNAASYWKNNSQTLVRCWGSSTYKTCVDGYTYVPSWVESNGTGASGAWYGYVDVPTDIAGWQIVRSNSGYWREMWNFVDCNVTGSFSSRVWRLAENGNDNYYLDSNKSDSAAGVDLMKKIVEAIDTCSSSSLNGYNAYSSLNTNFYSNCTSAAKAATCTSLSGSKAALSQTVQQHFEGMARRPGSLPGSNVLIPFTKENNSVIVVTMAMISIVGVGGYFFLKKKKQESIN